MKLIYLKNKEDEIINKIRNNGGEIDSETEANLEFTQTEIIKSIDAYANVIKKGIKAEKEYWKEKKAEIDKILKRIENNESYLKQQLHSLSIDEELIGEEFTIKPDTNTRRSINTNLVEPEFGTYIVEMTPQKYLEHFIDKPDDVISTNRKVLLKDLPENHKAIEEEITPTIKIIKTK